jgi:hypothetical protein
LRSEGHPLCEAKRAGRLNVELASLANAILAYQKEPLTQVEPYALQAAGAELPRDPPKHFGYGCIAPESRAWLHGAGPTLILDQGFQTRDWDWGPVPSVTAFSRSLPNVVPCVDCSSETGDSFRSTEGAAHQKRLPGRREPPDNGKNREHCVQIRNADRDNHNGGDPLGVPGDIQNQQDMKSPQDAHGDPKPYMPSQSPLYCDSDTNHPNAIQYWPRKIRSSKVIEQPKDRDGPNNQAQHAPPG